MKNYRVKEFFQAEQSNDGRIIWARFNLEDGSRISLEFTTDMLRQIQHYLSGVLSAAEAKSNLTEQRVVRAEGIARWQVAPAEGEDVVLISIRTGSGLLHNYALPSIDAQGLSEGLANAVQKGKPSGPPH